MIGYIIGIILILAIPCLIVGLWRSRPVAAFITASLVLVLICILPLIVKTGQAMMIYGHGDTQLVAGLLSEAILTTILSLIVFLPILLLFQWIVRRRYKSRAENTTAAGESADQQTDN